MKPLRTATAVRLLVIAAWLVRVVSVAAALNPPGSGLAGSSHDFTRPRSGVNQTTRNGDMCVFCHVRSAGSSAVLQPPWGDSATLPTLTPNASRNPRDAFVSNATHDLPLWNHQLTYAPYTMYQSGPGAPMIGPKASQATGIDVAPGSISLVCLGCHDGSVAINIVGKNNYLGNHHPIGFDYDAVRSTDREIRPAEFGHLTANTTVRDHLYGPAKESVECGTCHSVHNSGNSGGTLLWKGNARSALCLTCHDKGTYPGLP